TSSDQGQLAVYGAQRRADGALTLMVINKSTSDLTSPLAIGNFTPAAPAQVYRYSGANLGAVQRLADQPVSGGGLGMTHPATSITLLVLPSAAASLGANP